MEDRENGIELEQMDMGLLRSYYGHTGNPAGQINVESLGNRLVQDLWGETLICLEKGDYEQYFKCIAKVEKSELSYAGKQWLLSFLVCEAPVEVIEHAVAEKMQYSEEEPDKSVLEFAESVLRCRLDQKKKKQMEEDALEERRLEDAKAELLAWENKKRQTSNELEQLRRTNGN